MWQTRCDSAAVKQLDASSAMCWQGFTQRLQGLVQLRLRGVCAGSDRAGPKYRVRYGSDVVRALQGKGWGVCGGSTCIAMLWMGHVCLLVGSGLGAVALACHQNCQVSCMCTMCFS